MFGCRDNFTGMGKMGEDVEEAGCYGHGISVQILAFNIWGNFSRTNGNLAWACADTV